MDEKDKRDIEALRAEIHEADRTNILKRILSLTVMAIIISICFLFYTVFSPDEYDTSIYYYQADVSVMKDITDNKELVDEIMESINEYPVGPQEITIIDNVYINKHNGIVEKHVRMREDGICDVEKTTRVSYKKQVEVERDLRFDSILNYKMDKDKLTRVCKSEGGYIAVFNFVRPASTIPALEITNYVYLNANKEKIGEIWTGKTSDNRYIYKTQVIYNVKEGEIK